MANGFWGQILQSGSAGGPAGPTLRDFTHASKTFTTNGYALAPKFKFLFHVYFEINAEAYDVPDNNFSLAVKTAKLPTFQFATETLNQYNRKRIIQTKIKYNPVNITFHDDNSNMMTQMWESYYTYNYKDGSNYSNILKGARGGINQSPDVGLDGGSPDQSYNIRNIYAADITGNSNWGYTGEGTGGSLHKLPFFKNITIFGLNQHHFTAYTLINPVIISFNHDTYNYGESGGTMEMTMDLDYETVVYNEGGIDGRTPGQIVKGFGSDQTYDRTLSPITPPDANGYVSGQGGYVPAAGGFLSKLFGG